VIKKLSVSKEPGSVYEITIRPDIEFLYVLQSAIIPHYFKIDFNVIFSFTATIIIIIIIESRDSTVGIVTGYGLDD
jgi:hypothetical protein